MKPITTSPLNLTVLLCLTLSALLSCSGREVSAVRSVRHLAAKKYEDGQQVYIDKVDPRTIMRNYDSEGKGNSFSCYKVSFVDSTPNHKKQDMKWGQYFQYDIQKDWYAMVRGDTIPAVFFQTIPTLNQMVSQGILVFEIANERQTDTLVYKRTFSSNTTDLFVLKP